MVEIIYQVQFYKKLYGSSADTWQARVVVTSTLMGFYRCTLLPITLEVTDSDQPTSTSFGSINYRRKKYYVAGPISGGTLEGALVAAVVLDALPISLSCYFHHFYEICAMHYK